MANVKSQMSKVGRGRVQGLGFRDRGSGGLRLDGEGLEFGVGGILAPVNSRSEEPA